MIPEHSKAYHLYAARLNSLELCHEEQRIKTHFVLTGNDVVKKCGKGKTATGAVRKLYLFDEILTRTRKTFCELMYCNKFLRELPIRLHSIEVQVDAFHDQNSYDPFESHKYVLHEKGYPTTIEALSFADLCDAYDNATGNILKTNFESAAIP
jgi:hypothetical protein